MATRSLTDDQRADTLTYYLTILTQTVSLAVAHMEALMREPASPDREHSMAEILSALDRVNEKALHLGLRKSLHAMEHEKQRLATLVAQQRHDSAS